MKFNLAEFQEEGKELLFACHRTESDIKDSITRQKRIWKALGSTFKKKRTGADHKEYLQTDIA